MKRLRYIIPLAIATLTLLYVALPAGAVDPALPSFERTWNRTDKGIADGVYSRTWFWGPLDLTLPAEQETYAEAPGGMRTVQYYDKSRMEDNSWRTSTAPWDVTNGLLANELMTGKMQVGDNTFDNRSPSQGNVAGDPVTPNGATYAVYGTKMDLPAQPVGTTLIQRMDAAGTITDDASLAAQAITVGFVDDVTKHGIATPFWDFMNSSGTIWNGSAYVEGPLMLNPFFATGRPRTEAYWDDILVDGATKLVLTQCFERRCLTYTPSNSELWRVEMGNIGQHYYKWRNDTPPPTATATTPVETPTATATNPDDESTVSPSATSSDDEPTASATVTEPDVELTASATATEPEDEPTVSPSSTIPAPLPTATTPNPSPTSTTPTSNGGSVDVCLDGAESEFLAIINNYRAQNGLAPLAASSTLNRAAYNHSLDMGQRGYFGHLTPENVTPTQRIEAAGHGTFGVEFTSVAENIAAGNESAADTFEQWRTSSGHNANMLSQNLTAIGIGRATVIGSQHTWYWTTVFTNQQDGDNCP